MAKAMAGEAVSNEHEVGRDQLPFEFMLNALRLKEGFELAQFSERTGLPITAIQRGLEQAEAKGLLGRDFVRAWPTGRGFDFLSDLQALFLPG
jgi:oxygen-independent coproporphyrinogen-3 oxidase